MLFNEFLKSYEYSILGLRQFGFHKMTEHFSQFLDEEIYIIETGTARTRGSWNSEGQSTLIWDWFAKRNNKIKVISIDISQNNINVAQGQTSCVEYKCGDSVTTLRALDRKLVQKCKLLYLDSFDYLEGVEEESSQHHLNELQAVWDDLPKGCLVAVDDRLSDDKGKHVMVEKFMKSNNISPYFIDYQIGWIK